MPIRKLFGQTYDEIAVVADQPVPVKITDADITLNVDVGPEVEIKNDAGNPIPVLQGFALPLYDEFEFDDDEKPTEITYSLGGEVVATVTLVYADEGAGGLISGSIAYPSEEE